jgi:hypothetical protein
VLSPLAFPVRRGAERSYHGEGNMETEHPSTLFGFVVALALREPVANLSCYVGTVVTTDDQGILIALWDWLIGGITGMDFYVPWSNITGVMVASEEDEELIKKLAAFQARCDPDE